MQIRNVLFYNRREWVADPGEVLRHFLLEHFKNFVNRIFAFGNQLGKIEFFKDIFFKI